LTTTTFSASRGRSANWVAPWGSICSETNALPKFSSFSMSSSVKFEQP
jgi:hypothetical protein